MIFQRCFQLAVAATVSISTLSLHAQSTRATTDEMDGGGTITSLTSLHSPRHAPAPFGAINASATGSVILDVSVPPDVKSAEIGNQLQSGTASQPGSNSLQGKNLQFLTGSLSAARVSSAQRPGSLSMQSASPQSSVWSAASQSQQSAHPRSLRSVTPELPQSASPQFSAAPAAGNMSQSGSVPNASPASKTSGHQPPGDGYRGADLSGSSRSLSGLSSSRSHQSALGALAISSRPQQSVSDVSAHDAGSLNVNPATYESSTNAADKRDPKSFFETVENPFGDPLANPFAGSVKHFGMEQACGDACLIIKGPSHRSEDVSSEKSESARSVEPTDRSALHRYGALGHSRLEHAFGRLSEDSPRSGSEEARGRLKDMEKIEPGSAGSASRREPSN